MATTTTQPNTNVRAAARPDDWSRWLLRLLALALVVLGLGLLAAELDTVPAAWAGLVGVAGHWW